MRSIKRLALDGTAAQGAALLARPVGARGVGDQLARLSRHLAVDEDVQQRADAARQGVYGEHQLDEGHRSEDRQASPSSPRR